ncbi:MAG: hypothetical protein ACRD27_12605 [Terracidiphilus sp.]
MRVRYFEPARRRKESLVTLRAGDIHRELGLRNRVPNVCQVMESKLLEKEAGVKVSSRQGPPSGRGTTLTVTYAVDLEAAGTGAPENRKNEAKPLADHPGVALFLALRGSGVGLYDEEGGGEAWLKRERESFYGPEKKDLQ